jgi:hypothetical protein
METQTTVANAEGETDLYVYKQRHDGERMEVIIARFKVMDGQKQPGPTLRRIWSGNQYLFKQRESEGKPADLHVVTSQKKPDDLLTSTYGGSFLWGIYSRDVVEILRQQPGAFLHPNTETMGTSTCYVVDGSDQEQEYTVWVDPACGYNIRKLRAIWKMPEKEFEALNSKRIARNRPIEVVNQVDIEVSRIQRIGGHFVPTDGSMTVTMSYDDGTHEKVVFTSRRSSVEFNPDFEAMGAFIMDGIPSGTPVFHADYPGIHYVWGGDGPIVDTPLNAVEQIDAAMAAQAKQREQDEGGKLTTNRSAGRLASRDPHLQGTARSPESFGRSLWLPLGLALVVATAAGLLIRVRSQRRRRGDVEGSQT